MPKAMPGEGAFECEDRRLKAEGRSGGQDTLESLKYPAAVLPSALGGFAPSAGPASAGPPSPAAGRGEN
ncbi:MAG: hypothetical protein NZ602_14360 [Thermoguttaceae bacterium]|nr:hypothetical protein [Thermoguttaceae bacterium]